MDRRELLKYLGAAGAALHPLASAVATSSPDEILGQPEASGAGVFLNQVGYLPAGSKQATVRLADANPRDFLVRSLADHAVVFKGKLGAVATDAASGDQTGGADFSSLRVPGRYQLEMAGVTSDPITVAPDVYASALRL